MPLSLAVWSDIVHPGLYCKPRNPDPHHPKHQTHTLRTPLPPPKINTTKNTLFKNKKKQFRGCTFHANAARKGEDLYNHGGLAEVYCAQSIGRTYNKPKACIFGGVLLVYVNQSVCFIHPCMYPRARRLLTTTLYHMEQQTQVGGHVVQDCFTCPAGQYGALLAFTSPAYFRCAYRHVEAAVDVGASIT